MNPPLDPTGPGGPGLPGSDDAIPLLTALGVLPIVGGLLSFAVKGKAGDR